MEERREDRREEPRGQPGEQPHKRGRHEIKLGRVEALVDAIFGFAMTLLVLNLVITQGLNTAELTTALRGQIDNILVYALSFLILGSFWIIINWEYVHMRSSDTVHVWLNIFALMFVALMPFSTLVLADYYNTWQAEFFFAANVILLGIFLSATWYYATRERRLVEPRLDRETIRIGLIRSLLTPGVGIVVMAAAMFIPQWSPFFYLLVPLFQFTPIFRRRFQ